MSQINLATGKASDLRTKEQILECAVKEFADFGHHGASLRKICEKAHVNVSAVKYYFGHKDGLYRACFENLRQNLVDQFTTLFTPCESFEEFELKWQMFTGIFLEHALQNIEYIRLVSREIETFHPLIEDIFKNSFLRVHDHLLAYLAYGRDQKFLAEDIDLEILTTTFFHSLIMSVLKDHIRESIFKKSLRDLEYRQYYIKNFIRLWLHGARYAC